MADTIPGDPQRYSPPPNISPVEIASAQLTLTALAPGGKVPSQWISGPQVYKTVGAYTIVTHPDTKTVNIYWADGDKGLQYSYASGSIDYSSKVETGEHTGVADTETVIGGGIIDTVGGLISAITNPSLWKRIGLGAAGVVIILLVFVFFMKREL